MEKISNKNFIEELIVENVNFSFGFKEILKDINFTLKKGEVVSIVGPSGGGKTTLLHLCSKLLKLDTGRIKNSFLSSTFAFQEPRLLPWKNVIDNISLALKAKGEKTNIAEQKAKDIAILFGLQESDFSKFPKDLSGGGKTTLLHLCSKLLKLDTGRIKNSFLSSTFAFQEPRLLPWKNVIDNISLALKAKGEKTNIAEQKAKDIAILFGLQESDFSKFPKDLSGGMKQRVSFARALVVNPSLLFLDEPFSALDIGLKKELQNLLIKNIENNNLSILFITHDLMEAIKLSDKIIVLKAQPIGHIKKIFTINEAREKRDDEFVYSKTAEILKDKDIISSFELELK